MVDKKTKKEEKKNPKMVIFFSESDLQDLINGEEFRWTFTTDQGQDIDVLLRPDNEHDYIDDVYFGNDEEEQLF